MQLNSRKLPMILRRIQCFGTRLNVIYLHSADTDWVTNYCYIIYILFISNICSTPKQMAGGLIESVFLKSVDISISENKRFYQFEGYICASNFDAGRSK